MKLRSILAAVAAAGFLATAGSASAIITITSTADALDAVANGAALPSNGAYTMIDNFGDGGGSQNPVGGFTFSPQVFDQDGGVGGYIRNGAGPPQLLGGESAPPPVGGVYETGNYYTVTANGGPHIATLTVASGYLTHFSFYLGSPDTYNSLSFYDAAGLVARYDGNAIWACPSCGQTGDQTYGARAYYNFGGAHITSVVFGATGNSFEFDNLAGVRGGIPEPTTWGLMIMGFGGIGALLRRRRQVTAFA